MGARLASSGISRPGALKMLSRSGRWLIAAAVGWAVGTPAIGVAQDWQFRLSAGAGLSPDYEGSDNYRPLPLVALGIKKGPYYLESRGTGLRANVLPSQMWNLGPVVNYRFKRNNVSDDRVDDLRTVDEAWELGLFGSFRIRNSADPRYSVGAELQATKDVAAGHSGWLVELSGKYRMPLAEKWQLGLGAGGTWADNNYMDTYFSVDDDNSRRSGLREFSADSGIKDVGVNANLNWAFYGNWGATFLLNYKRLLGDADDSPIVDDRGSSNQFFGGALIGYRW